MKEQKVDTRQRKISNIRFNKVLFTSILVCGIFISGIFYLWIYQGLRYGYEAERPSTETFETVSTEETITQEFIAREYYLKGIEFVFINLAEDGNGELDFRVLDSDGRIKANSEIAISSAPAKGATYVHKSKHLFEFISIHAPAKGATLLIFYNW